MTSVRVLAVSVLLAACAALQVHASLFSAKGGVVHAHGGNFAQEVTDIEKPTLVAFTAPWCGHCQRLAPEYERAAAKLDGIVKLAYVDCDDKGSQAICQRYGVEGFPTLKLFPATKKRAPKDYKGERSAQSIVDYAVDALPLTAVRKLSPADVESYLSKNPEKAKVVLYSSKCVA